MSVKILIRRGTAAQWTAANPILSAGEFGYETDTKKLKIGNGTSAWSALPYAGAADVIPASAFTARGQLITGSDTADYAVLSIGSAGTFLVEDPVAGTLAYEGINLNELSDVNTSGAVTNDLFARGSSQWEKQSFSTALTANEETVRQVIANGDMTKRRMIGVAGYMTRGDINSNVYKWSFPSETVSSTTSAPVYMRGSRGFGNPAIAGYFSRGFNNSNGAAFSDVYKWSFPSDSQSTTTSAPAGMIFNDGFANPAVAGYFSRGSNTTTVYKWAFPADTVTTTTAAPANMNGHAGFANPAVAGYFSQGNATTVYKWAFPGDTVSTTTAAPGSMFSHAGFANPNVAGYFSRSVVASPYSITSDVYKWSFPTDVATTATSAPGGMRANAGFANPSVAGYFSAADLGFPYSSTMYRWSFPVDTATVSTSAPAGMREHGGFSNA
jgi:hypothetical protein